ncbi:MAG TPA: carboxypeptidase-like regulatory domain-containing protein, partial [Ohtaekwangia sp.]
PLPGVNIVIKGTTTGTTTDANGYYSIRVPVGAVLVFSFIGMRTQEVLVTEKNLQPAPVKSSAEKNSKPGRHRQKDARPVHSLYKDTLSRKVPGVAVLTDETPSYAGKKEIDPDEVHSIRRSGNKYLIRTRDMIQRTGFSLQFTTSYGIDQVNKLPHFQTTYAQGRPFNGALSWQGADQQEIFSWGPLVKTLEFDGSNYPYDKNGKLVPAGTGNSIPAKIYDARNFFRDGSVFANELMFALPTAKSGTLLFDVESRDRKGIIPHSDYQRLNASVKLKNFRPSKNISVNASASANRSQGNLLTRGGNLSAIIGSVYRTPVTFDNTNGQSNKNAVHARDAYRLVDGTVRSHAPGLADNPFGLVNELPDDENLQRLMGSLSVRYTKDKFEFILAGDADYQQTDNTFGIPAGYSGYPDGRITQRSDDQLLTNIFISPSYTWYGNGTELKLSGSYQNQYTYRDLTRRDGFGFNGESLEDPEAADHVITRENTLGRVSHEVMASVKLERNDWLILELTNRSYFSNTIKPGHYTNLFPTLGASIDLSELIYVEPIQDLKFFASLSRSIREGPLLYSNWAYGSARMAVENYNAFYENNELFFHDGLNPETERKFEVGTKLFVFSGLSFHASWFHNRTLDFIAPVWNGDQYQLANAADVKNYGSSIELGYNGRIGSEIDLNTYLRWSTYNTVALHVPADIEYVALAGFETIQTALASGKTVGSIYGTTYLRDEDGNKIIGNDGFPIENMTLKKIGDPIPDWTLGWSTYLSFRKFTLSFLFDFRKGGSVWNGTNAMLDYLGRSSATGKLRNTSNFVFDGVDSNGNRNTVPVNFADPSKPLSENRWVRHGWDGVGEDYIEDASWFRLNELTCSYQIVGNSHSRIKEVKLSLIGRNLFVVTPYSGVDPYSTLFGNASGSGLDLFNTPSTRSYSVQLTFKM